MYLRYIAIAFLTNGLGAFGLRILAGAGLGSVDQAQYLTWWYAAGLAMAALVFFRRNRRPQANELAIGSGMALCSLLGQTGMVMALAGGVPGFVVFPVATGGGMLVVAAVGVFLYKEPIGWLGCAGIATGVCALILLALPD